MNSLKKNNLILIIQKIFYSTNNKILYINIMSIGGFLFQKKQKIQIFVHFAMPIFHKVLLIFVLLVVKNQMMNILNEKLSLLLKILRHLLMIGLILIKLQKIQVLRKMNMEQKILSLIQNHLLLILQKKTQLKQGIIAHLKKKLSMKPKILSIFQSLRRTQIQNLVQMMKIQTIVMMRIVMNLMKTRALNLV